MGHRRPTFSSFGCGRAGRAALGTSSAPEQEIVYLDSCPSEAHSGALSAPNRLSCLSLRRTNRAETVEAITTTKTAKA